MNSSRIISTGLTLCLILCFFSCTPPEKQPAPEKGLLDLSEWNFKKNGPVNLKGEWEFYWKTFIHPDGFQAETVSAPLIVKVPATWNHYKINDQSLPGHGYATYRIKIIIPETDINKEYGLKLYDFSSAYNLWINGKHKASNGLPGKSKDEMKPQFLPKVVTFHPETDEIELIFHVSNFYDKKGGIWHNITFGLEKQVLSQREWRLIFEAFLFGILLIMAIYHLGLFALRQKDRSTLYFSIFSFILALRSILVGERLLVQAFPYINWELQLNLEHLTFYIGVPVFMLFCRSLFKDEIHKIPMKALMGIGVLFSIILFFTPAAVHTMLIPPFQIITLAAIIYVMTALTIALIRKKEGSVYILTGFAVLALTVINDFLYDHKVIYTGYLVQWGLMVFIFFQSLVISTRFSRAFGKAENLSVELAVSKKQIEDYSETLENKVEERTKLLISQKKTLEEEIGMAKKIHKLLLPENLPDNESFETGALYKPMIAVGGDLYDLKYRNNAELGIFICDVSGHGVSGALLSSMVKISLNQWDETLDDPAKTLEMIHKSIKDKLGNHFISACACHLDLSKGILNLANAGHPPTYILRADGRIETIKVPGYVLSKFFASQFDPVEIKLFKGDRIVLYTDGLTESRNDRQELFGEVRFKALLTENSPLAPQQICTNVLNEIKKFTGNRETFEDDITLLVIEYKG